MNELPNDSCWDLERDGFEVFRDVFHASNLVRSAAAERTGNEFKDVFGSEDSEGVVKRWQRPVQIDVSFDCGLHAVLDAVKRKVQPLYPDLKFRDEYVLRSDPGCPVQEAHADYRTRCHLSRRSMGCLVAIKPHLERQIQHQTMGLACMSRDGGGNSCWWVCFVSGRSGTCRDGVDAHPPGAALSAAHVPG